MAMYNEDQNPYGGGEVNPGVATDPSTAPPPSGNARLDYIHSLYKKYFGRDGTPEEWAQHLNFGGTDGELDQLFAGSTEAKQYAASQTTPTNTTPTTPPPPGGGTPGNFGELVAPYGKTFTPPPMLNLGGPEGLSYIPPTPTPDLPSFKAPNFNDLLNDPSYKFRVDQGIGALSQSAAAKGTLGDTGTAKGLIDYGQQAGSQEMQNYWNRSVGQFGLDYQRAMDQFAPKMTGWSTTAAAGQHQNDANYANAFARFQQDYNMWNNWQTNAFNRKFAVTTA